MNRRFHHQGALCLVLLFGCGQYHEPTQARRGWDNDNAARQCNRSGIDKGWCAMFAASDIGTPSPTPEPGGGTVAVVGDSISVGIVTPLATALGENYTVTGYGTGGAPVTSIVAQVTNNVAPSPRDYLVIIGGTADTRAQTGAAIASALGTDAVNEAAPSGATVVLCNLVAMGDNASGDPAARQAIIAAANVLINANQNADIVVDLYSNTVDEFDAQIGALFDLDTVHPNNAGDQLLAEVIAAAIEAG